MSMGLRLNKETDGLGAIARKGESSGELSTTSLRSDLQVIRSRWMG